MQQRAGRRAVSRRTASSCGPGQCRSHSAHVGQEVEIFYRWHALYGRRLQRQYIEHRATGDVVHVQVEPGVVVVVAAWMLDAAACSGMELGEPRASLAALTELHHFLCALGFRPSSCGVSHTVYEEQDDQSNQTTSDTTSSSPIVGAPPTGHCVRVPGTRGTDSQPTSQRGHSTRHLAAAGSRSPNEGGEQ
jgi:hypothetical protein